MSAAYLSEAVSATGLDDASVDFVNLAAACHRKRDGRGTETAGSAAGCVSVTGPVLGALASALALRNLCLAAAGLDIVAVLALSSPAVHALLGPARVEHGVVTAAPSTACCAFGAVVVTSPHPKFMGTAAHFWVHAAASVGASTQAGLMAHVVCFVLRFGVEASRRGVRVALAAVGKTVQELYAPLQVRSLQTASALALPRWALIDAAPTELEAEMVERHRQLHAEDSARGGEFQCEEAAGIERTL